HPLGADHNRAAAQAQVAKPAPVCICQVTGLHLAEGSRIEIAAFARFCGRSSLKECRNFLARAAAGAYLSGTTAKQQPPAPAMPIRIIGMIGVTPPASDTQLIIIEGALSPDYVVEAARAHEAADFDSALVGYSSSSA